MSGFTPAERIDVDTQYRLLAKDLHALGPDWANRLRAILTAAEAAPSDPTLARVLVAAEIMRGIAADGRSPLTIRGFALPGAFAQVLKDAEALGRDLGPHVHPPKRGLFTMLARPRPRLSRQAREALMRCRMVGVRFERRATQSGRAIQTP